MSAAGDSPASPTHPFADAGHDHARCVSEALEAAARLCARRGARLTTLRRRVLELVWGSHAPQGAYAILETLHRDGRRAAPPTVYRALDFLLGHGLIHRIESLNAFVGCPAPGRPHVGQFLICSACGCAAELDDRRIGVAIRDSAGKAGFRLEGQTIELRGLCPRCQNGRGDGRDAA
ncbi:MAG: Fur family transcriptional regulator [Alphaproteobacteria bacterium]